ncbi:MAG: type II toxin-antitoxin system HipA family toxin [Oscillospiraceae bacterium]|nr:type II toxin-antitoxin system HipA family toxin [Oscillospiraceae bacterium]
MDVRTVKVTMWGSTIGYLHRQDNGLIGFQYDENFIPSGIEVSPIRMPLSELTYSFPGLPEETFSGLPGMLADSLPDKFGNIVIKRYLESQGRTEDSLTALEKLCYTGQRGMGALEYEPSINITDIDEDVDIDALTKLASDILSERENLDIKYDDNMIAQLMQGSSSVGGARAKTLIALNPETNAVRSGQIRAGEGFEYWLLKFDDIANNKDKDKEPDNKEYTRIEYAYYLMAKAAGIKMSECRLFKENGRAHFMTKRFDRKGDKGEKLHMQSLCAIAHMDFNSPRMYSYEDAFSVMRQLNLPHIDFVQLYKRMIFNEYAKNYDDHTKNITFLMDKKGVWRLSPAYDVTFSYSRSSTWVNAHQMLINGKADEITRDDFIKAAEKAGIKKAAAEKYIKQVRNAVSNWSSFAEEAGLSLKNTERIQKFFDL